MASTASDLNTAMEVTHDSELSEDGLSITSTNEGSDFVNVQPSEDSSSAKDSEMGTLDSEMEAILNVPKERLVDIDDHQPANGPDFLTQLTNMSHANEIIEYQSLSNSTSDKEISHWCPSTLAMILEQYDKAHDNSLTIDYKKVDSRILRRLVRDLRDQLVEQDDQQTFVSNVQSHIGTYHKFTEDWEIFI